MPDLSNPGLASSPPAGTAAQTEALTDAPGATNLALSSNGEGPLAVRSLDLEGQGVAHREDGKVVFIDGALPYELVSARVHRSKASFDKGTLTVIHQESSQRVRPACPHFGLHAGACGGCKMQHLHPAAQVAVKQRAMEDQFQHIGKLRPERILRPIEGPSWGYRYRARLSVRFVRKKGAVLIGFHERKSHFVADMQQCLVLPPHVSAMLLPLRALIASMDAVQHIPQIELAIGDRGGLGTSESQGDVTALVLRHLLPLSDADRSRLQAFALDHPGVQWWLQAKGPDAIVLLDAQDEQRTGALAYSLPEYGITMPFKPTDFTQVNPYINRVLVARALGLLDVQRSERVIDWFCGLGNFTLPLATRAREVLGVEGAEFLVARSRHNYQFNQAGRGRLPHLAPTQFFARNLFEMTAAMVRADGQAEKWLLDPPREGAFALVQALAEAMEEPNEQGKWQAPHRIVYVSCNPATLARDAAVLVTRAGYRCSAAGVVNMFAHTAHVESIAVFDLADR